MNPAAQQMSEDNPAGSIRSQTDDGTGNVDKIRDILFGANMRDYETRFKKLEETLLRESAEIRDMTKKRLDALEEYIKREFESQSQRLKNEREERTTNIEQQTRDLRDLSQNMSRRLAESNDFASEAHRSIREEILSKSNGLLEELQHRHQESNSTVERYVSELRNDKADRATIASLLSEMAMRLTGEFKLPDPGSRKE
jgi:hypothetical protein